MLSLEGGESGDSVGVGHHHDLEKQQSLDGTSHCPSQQFPARDTHDDSLRSIAVSNGELLLQHPAPDSKFSVAESVEFQSSKKPTDLSRSSSSHDQCRVCQQEKDEALIELGCHCRGGLAKAHQSCISTWFGSRGSNKCEICQQVARNITLPESQANYWVWRLDPAHRGRGIIEGRVCFSPLWVAFSILIVGLLLDVLVSITLGVSALPVNIIIGIRIQSCVNYLIYLRSCEYEIVNLPSINNTCAGVIVVLGLGTALRLALEFCHEWNLRRIVHQVEANASLGYHPAL